MSTSKMDSIRQFGRYTLLKRFASGGMANLYLATLDGTDGFKKMVAVKMMHRHLSDDPEFVNMFIDEARLASRISHPNVVQILELGRIKDNLFIAMEYVEGESVRALLQRARPEIPHCVHIVAAAAAGIHAAHELRDVSDSLLEVVHRDVSPDNILISYKGAIKVVDFGVARARDNLHSTSAGSLKGKFGYMAPEQALSRPIDRRVDIFALGIVLYEMTTYRRLFKKPTEAETLQMVIHCDVPPPSKFVSDYPPYLEQIVLKALHPDPEHRFQTAQEFQDALETFLVKHGTPVFQSTISKMMTSIFSDHIKAKQVTIDDSFDDPDIEIEPLDENDAYSSIQLEPDEEFAPRWSTAKIIFCSGLGLFLVMIGLSLFLSFGKKDTGNISSAEPLRSSFRRNKVTPAIKPSDKRSKEHQFQSAMALTVAQHKEGNKNPRSTGQASQSTDEKKIKSARPKKDFLEKKHHITVEVNAKPEHAAIFIDGKLVSNPFRSTFVRGDGQLQVVVRAKHHRPKTVLVPLGQSGKYTIALHPQSIRKRVSRKNSRLRRSHDKIEQATKTTRLQLNDDEVLNNPYE